MKRIVFVARCAGGLPDEAITSSICTCSFKPGKPPLGSCALVLGQQDKLLSS